jgi:hypothetical protein
MKLKKCHQVKEITIGTSFNRLRQAVVVQMQSHKITLNKYPMLSRVTLKLIMEVGPVRALKLKKGAVSPRHNLTCHQRLSVVQLPNHIRGLLAE